MPQSATAEGGEKARTRDARKPGIQSAKRSRSPTISVEMVSLSDICLEDKTFQYRFPSTSKDVRSSLENQRQREPIDLVGVSPPYRIVDGFRRITAAQDLGWDCIEAFVHRGVDGKEAMRIAFTKNVVRKNLSSL